MEIFILFVGAIFGLSALNGTVGKLFGQINSDMFGDGKNKGFLIWLGAIIVIAAVMRSVDLPDVGKAFVVLLIVVFLLSNGGLLGQLLDQVQQLGRIQAAQQGSSGAQPGGGSGGAAGGSTPPAAGGATTK